MGWRVLGRLTGGQGGGSKAGLLHRGKAPACGSTARKARRCPLLPGSRPSTHHQWHCRRQRQSRDHWQEASLRHRQLLPRHREVMKFPVEIPGRNGSPGLRRARNTRNVLRHVMDSGACNGFGSM